MRASLPAALLRSRVRAVRTGGRAALRHPDAASALQWAMSILWAHTKNGGAFRTQIMLIGAGRMHYVRTEYSFLTQSPLAPRAGKTVK